MSLKFVNFGIFNNFKTFSSAQMQTIAKNGQFFFKDLLGMVMEVEGKIPFWMENELR